MFLGDVKLLNLLKLKLYYIVFVFEFFKICINENVCIGFVFFWCFWNFGVYGNEISVLWWIKGIDYFIF